MEMMKRRNIGDARLSLLGKPLNYRAHKRDLRQRRAQMKIYNFLERSKAPATHPAMGYKVVEFLMVFMCLVLSVLVTIPEHRELMTQCLFFVEIVMVLWFMVEYTLRVWSAGCRSRYQGLAGRAKFARRPSCILDLIIIVASIILLSVGSIGQVFATALRGLRFFQILRMVRMDRRGGSWKLLGSVVWAHRQELVTTLYIGFLGLIFSSFLVFLVEKDHSEKRFSTYADSLWWGVITLCTVGYGDTVPETWAGKLIAACCAILGISFFALPAGILGSGFALKVQQQQRQKHLIRRRVPAAMLIQSLWRCYAADENSISIATWKPHMIPCPSPSAETTRRGNSSFVSRFSTRRRDRGFQHNNNNNSNNVPQCPSTPTTRYGSGRRQNMPTIHPEEGEIPDALNRRSPLSLAVGDKESMPSGVRKDTSVSSFTGKDSEDDVDASSPSMTQLTETHKKAIRAIRKIRYFVARKKFREALRPYDVKDVIEQYSAGHVDMLSRIKNLQFRLDQILGKAGGKGKDVYDSKISLASRVVKVERQVDDIESKLDLLIDMYREDREYMMQQQQVFKALLQSNDQLTHTVAVSAVPEQIVETDENSRLSQSPKPRPILVDKSVRGTSEPVTPTTPILRNPVRPMHRNHSDLGSRVKKKVTYSGCINLAAAPLRRRRDVKFSEAPTEITDSTRSCENIPLQELPESRTVVGESDTTNLSNTDLSEESQSPDSLNFYTAAFENIDQSSSPITFSADSQGRNGNDQTYTVQGEDNSGSGMTPDGAEEKQSLLGGDKPIV